MYNYHKEVSNTSFLALTKSVYCCEDFVYSLKKETDRINILVAANCISKVDNKRCWKQLWRPLLSSEGPWDKITAKPGEIVTYQLRQGIDYID